MTDEQEAIRLLEDVYELEDCSRCEVREEWGLNEPLWRQYLDGLNALRDERGMTVIQIAHTDIKRFDSPEHEPYDRYVIKLHARAAALLQEHSDVVLFANYRISTVKADVGFNKKVNRALGSGERVLYTAERPAFLAKNRYGLPDVLPLDWQAFAAAMPQLTPTDPQT
jgi:hypothetical protein